MFNGDVISMPDKWEYPCTPPGPGVPHPRAVAGRLRLRQGAAPAHAAQPLCAPERQIPAYEWNFSDVNPPVHAWATLFLFKVERNLGREDLTFLSSRSGLMLNFNWWVNRKDRRAERLRGGFLGLDNIGVFDRSAPLPPAAAWNRPTAPPGWRSTASAC